ncbi:MAG: hypothetical protein AAF432_14525, partial [Planctomycetota bacterium]
DMGLRIRQGIFVLICLVPFVGAVYAGWNIFTFRTGNTPLSIADFRSKAASLGGERVTLTGGGLTWCSQLVAAPDGVPVAYWMPFVADTETDLEALEAATAQDGAYPFDTIILVKLTPEEYEARYPNGPTLDNVFVPEEFYGVLHGYNNWVSNVAWFRMYEQLGKPKFERVAFFEINGSTPKTRGHNAIALISGLLCIPAFFGILGLYFDSQKTTVDVNSDHGPTQNATESESPNESHDH